MHQDADLELARRWRSLRQIEQAGDAEARRDDQLHETRFQLREDDLRNAIEHAYEAMHEGPITNDDIDFAQRTMESRR